MIIHIDCNSFFASCEVAFHPELKGKPVVVANGNEAGGGIILALTSEAKKLGLKRGNPLFQVRKFMEDNNVIVFQVNHHKYRNISEQIMQLVIEQDIIQDFVQYSIDEFFGSIPIDSSEDVKKYVRQVKDMIMEKTEIPVSCGCSQTYTLAKAATWYAKHYEGYKGICVLSEANREKALATLPINEVWGIGRAHARFLAASNVVTALDFYQMSEIYVRHAMKTGGSNTWKELHGIPSVDISRETAQKSISQSLTFTYMIDNKQKLREILASFVSKLAFKLREQNSMCKTIMVFIRTNSHRPDLPQYSATDTRKLPASTQDTRVILDEALKLLDKVYKPRFLFKKMGIVLTDITHGNAVQLDLFESRDAKKSEKLMKVLDDINRKYGQETIHSALSDVSQNKAEGTEEL